MRRFMVTLASLALVSATPAGMKSAFAHGGQYRGPAGEVPPDSRQPEDPPPPDNGGGTPTPPDNGGGTPTPPDNGGGTPTPPDTGTPDNGGDPGGGVPQGPGGGTPGTATRGKVPKKNGPSYESWLFWWNYNKDRIINIKQAIRAGSSKSGTGLSTLTESDDGNETQTADLTARAVEEKVVPVLKRFAEDPKVNTGIQAAAVLSLAKIGRREMTGLMMNMASNSKSSEKYMPETEETAALSLGVLQDRSKAVRDFLGGVATNADARTRTRCFAAFSLGLLGGPDAPADAQAQTLDVLRGLVKGNESSKDVPNSALVAIGLLGDPSAIPDLLAWLGEEKAGTAKLNDVTLSYVAAALGKIGQPGTKGPSSTEVVEALKDQLNKKNRMTRYSSIIALGQIAPQGDEKVQMNCVRMLTQVIKSEGKGGIDAQAVNFALASLGRIGSVPADASGRGGCPVAVRDAALKELRDAFDGKNSQKNFAALGLGVLGRSLSDNVKVDIGEKIRTAVAKVSGDVEARGAMFIALGLLKDVQSVPMLQDVLQQRGGDKKLRGVAAVALGLIGESSSLEIVHKTLLEKDDKELRADTAIAAGLLKDTKAVSALVEILRDPKASQFVLGSVANALGQIGDQNAVEPLSQILIDTKSEYGDLTRSLAAVALGQIGDKNDIPVLSRISEDVNYRAYYDAIGEVLTIL